MAAFSGIIAARRFPQIRERKFKIQRRAGDPENAEFAIGA